MTEAEVIYMDNRKKNIINRDGIKENPFLLQSNIKDYEEQTE